jgi:ankyrin repeat protein
LTSFTSRGVGGRGSCTWLLARGAPREVKDVNGCTALYWASEKGHVDAVRALLAAGANVDAADSGITPLWVASSCNNTDAMRVLLAAGANVESGRLFRMRPLHVASKHGHVAATTLLLDAGADVNALNNYGCTPLAMAETPAMRALLAARGGV